ncbi:MAG TPA: MFS transporter [Blastocatellia bacterium]|nr:MFS transporter [Blastocatellia bacterium]
MASNRSPLFIIFITVFIDLIGFGIVIPILPIYAEKFGATPLTVGLLLASFSVCQFLATPILGRLSDRYGRRPILFFSLAGTSLAFLTMGFANALWLLFVARIVDGITGGNISTAQAYIADVTTPENRAKGLGMIGAAFGLGFIIGPAIGGVLSKFGLPVPFLFASALAAANAILLYFRLPETVKRDGSPAKASARRGWGIVGISLPDTGLKLILIVYFVGTVAFATLTATLALYTSHARQFHYDATHNGYIFTFVGIIGAIVQGGLLGRLVKQFGESLLVVVGLVSLGAGLAFLPYLTTLIGLLVALALIAIGNGLVTPSLTALASKRTSEKKQGEILGITQSLNSLARVIGPIVGNFLLGFGITEAAGSVSESTSVPGQAMASPFVMSAIVTALAFALAIFYYLKWGNKKLVGFERSQQQSET